MTEFETNQPTELDLQATFASPKVEARTWEDFVNAIEAEHLLYGGSTETEKDSFKVDGVLSHEDKHPMTEGQMRLAWDRAAENLAKKLDTNIYKFQLTESKDD